MTSKIILYGVNVSSPVRAVKLTLKALDLPFEYKEVDFHGGQHLTDEFININPQHTVPVLGDNGTWIWDSHAICTYLVSKYGKSDELYPKDLVKRAVVDQRMYFEASVLFMPIRNISMSFFRRQEIQVPKWKINDIKEGLELLDTFLGDHAYIAGESLTLADFSCSTTASNARPFVNLSEYPKITAWLDRLTKLPYYTEINEAGAAAYNQLIKSSLQIEQ